MSASKMYDTLSEGKHNDKYIYTMKGKGKLFENTKKKKTNNEMKNGKRKRRGINYVETGLRKQNMPVTALRTSYDGWGKHAGPGVRTGRNIDKPANSYLVHTMSIIRLFVMPDLVSVFPYPVFRPILSHPLFSPFPSLPSTNFHAAIHLQESRMELTLHATRRERLTTLLALVRAISAWSVKTRRAPSGHCRDARVWLSDYGLA